MATTSKNNGPEIFGDKNYAVTEKENGLSSASSVKLWVSYTIKIFAVKSVSYFTYNTITYPVLVYMITGQTVYKQ